MMASQKVVLTGPDRTWHDSAPEEVELGPFTQGVVIESDSLWWGPCLRDVASGRTLVVFGDSGHMLVEHTERGGHLVASGLPGSFHADRYRSLFVQTYSEESS